MIAHQHLIRRLGDGLRMAVGLCASVGEVARHQHSKLLQMAAVVSAALIAALRPSYWRRTIRNAFARAVLSSGVEAIGITSFLAIALGVLLVVQYQLWLGNIVQSQLVGPVFVAVVARELAPLLVNLVVIARSGATMAAELALVHVSGEDRVVEGLGIDPLAYYVIPRVLALTLSVLCLTLIFTAVFVPERLPFRTMDRREDWLVSGLHPGNSRCDYNCGCRKPSAEEYRPGHADRIDLLRRGAWCRRYGCRGASRLPDRRAALGDRIVRRQRHGLDRDVFLGRNRP